MRRKSQGCSTFGMGWIWLTLVTLTLLSLHIKAEWTDPLGQYHIQTDEGPERYFRYQTQSGQYRKEKRLEDGTVIGTYAWIDANGFLRQRDYIADNEGYRILRSKHLYVGTHVPIEQAIKAAKKAPAENGILVHSGAKNYGVTQKLPGYSTSLSSTTERIPAKPYVPSYPNNAPAVDVRPNSYPYDGFSNSPSSVSSTTHSSTPISTTLPPSISSNDIYNEQQTSAHYTSTPVPILSSTHSGLGAQRPVSTTISPSTLENDVGYNHYSGSPQYEHYPDNPYVHQNGPTYPIDKYGHTFNGQQNKIGNGYDPQYPEYDGVSVTNDGFRYYIPRAYHEEQHLPGNTKSGSFGYVDPFGIRRVIYYNASPQGGFQHRKNNRYVGLHATPYDPRPY